MDLRKRGLERLDQTIVVILELITKSRGHTMLGSTSLRADKDLPLWSPNGSDHRRVVRVKGVVPE